MQFLAVVALVDILLPPREHLAVEAPQTLSPNTELAMVPTPNSQ